MRRPAGLLVLGVRRSGTTLLRVMLDRHSALAIPDESYFVPQLAHRHRGSVDVVSFGDDLRRISRLRDWGLTAEDVVPRLRGGMTPGEAIAAVFEAYAERQGKTRWGDKTPLYMQYLPLLERLFPDALYLHLIRDGRDAALSHLAVPAGIMTAGWGHPTDVRGFACLWRSEVQAARALGARVGSGRYLELRYEDLVLRPVDELERVCAFAGLDYEPGLLGYVGTVDLTDKPHQQRLAQPPTPGVRDWRTEMSDQDERAFEEISGDLLAGLGYETRHGSRTPALARVRRGAYAARSGAWRASGTLLQRSPLWRLRHPPVA